MWALKGYHAEINPSLTAPLLRGGLGDDQLNSPSGEGVRRRKRGGRMERGAAGGSAGQGELMIQVPYHDLGQRARILYEDAVAEVEAARQRESECRAEIARLSAQVAELEAHGRDARGKVDDLISNAEQAQRDNARWFGLYKEATSSAGGVIGEVNALRRQCATLTADNAHLINLLQQLQADDSAQQQVHASAEDDDQSMVHNDTAAGDDLASQATSPSPTRP